MTFLERKIELKIELGNNAVFNPNADNTVVLTLHRVHASITKTTGRATGEARVRVLGLPPSTLSKIASLNQATAATQANRLTIKAGDTTSGMGVVFTGQIVLAQSDMSQMPETALNLMAIGAGFQAVQKIPASSYPGSADAAVILSNLATLANLSFRNYGATKMLATPCYEGDVKTQIEECARDAGFEHVIDDGELVIWPKGSVRGGPVALISPQTGLVGYPSYSSMIDKGGISVTCLFNPQLRIGAAVQVESGLIAATGKWGVFNISHELDAMVPSGNWFTHFDAFSYGG